MPSLKLGTHGGFDVRLKLQGTTRVKKSTTTNRRFPDRKAAVIAPTRGNATFKLADRALTY